MLLSSNSGNSLTRFQIFNDPKTYSFTLILQILVCFAIVSVWGVSIINLPTSLGIILFGITYIPALIFFWTKPEFGLLIYLFVSAGFFLPNFVEIAKIEARDILLFSVLGIATLKKILSQDLKIEPWPRAGFLFLFLFTVCFSTFYALFYVGSEFNWVLGEARMLLGYSIYFAIIWLIKDRKTFDTLLYGAIIISTLLSFTIIMQQFYGPDELFLPTMTLPGWHVWEEGSFVRVVAPTMIHIFMMLILTLGLTFKNILQGKISWFWTISLLINSFGLLFTFTRSAWLSSILSSLIMAVFFFPIYRKYFTQAIFVGISLVLCCIGLIGLISHYSSIEINFFSDISTRFSSIFEVQETSNSASLQWRKFEFQEAKKSIAQSPLMGVGLGGSYRNVVVYQGEAQGLFVAGDISYERIYRYTKFLHSGYLQFIVKMGIPAFLLFFGTYLKINYDSLQTFFQSWRSSDSDTIVYILGIIPCALLSLLFWAIFHEFFYSIGNTPFIGLALGFLDSGQLILRKEDETRDRLDIE